MPSTSVAETTAPQPDHVGRFRITRLLGTGSMGSVYLAEDPVIHRKVAIKTLNVNVPAADVRVFEDTFLNEARAAGRLNHPHIVTVYDAGRIKGQSYIAMEYLKGVELKELIARGEKFSLRQAVEIFVRVADALQYAHEHGVVHRDIKPANIFMIGKTNPKVLDFGIAQAMTSFSGSFVGGSFAQNIVGTPNYMSPELIQGRPLDGRSDIFSLGVVMYEVLTLEVPFKGRTFEELTRNIVNSHPTPPQDIAPHVPIQIARIIAKTLAKNSADRYASARDLANDLRKWMTTQRVRKIMSASKNQSSQDGAASTSNEQDDKSPAQRAPLSPMAFGLGAVAVAVAFLFGSWWNSTRLNKPDDASMSAASRAAPAKSELAEPPASVARPSAVLDTSGATNGDASWAKAPSSAAAERAPDNSAAASNAAASTATSGPTSTSPVADSTTASKTTTDAPSTAAAMSNASSATAAAPATTSASPATAAAPATTNASSATALARTTTNAASAPPTAGGAAADANAKPKPKPAPPRKTVAKPVPPPPVQAAPPPANGSVALAVSPWGEVFVDGSLRGLSPPLSTLTLSSGSHRIEIRNGDGEPYIATIEVRPNETVRIRHKF